jgi:hypothetical protein
MAKTFLSLVEMKLESDGPYEAILSEVWKILKPDLGDGLSLDADRAVLAFTGYEAKTNKRKLLKSSLAILPWRLQIDQTTDSHFELIVERKHSWFIQIGDPYEIVREIIKIIEENYRDASMVSAIRNAVLSDERIATDDVKIEAFDQISWKMGRTTARAYCAGSVTMLYVTDRFRNTFRKTFSSILRNAAKISKMAREAAKLDGTASLRDLL